MTEASGLLQCPRCRRYKSPDAFYSPEKRRQRREYACRECVRSAMRARYTAMRQLINVRKLEMGCVDCGYREHAEALEFDHLPGVEKIANVSKLISRGASLEVIETEIAKCELVCANCHRVRTTARGDSANGADHDIRKLGRTAGAILVVEDPQPLLFPELDVA